MTVLSYNGHQFEENPKHPDAILSVTAHYSHRVVSLEPCERGWLLWTIKKGNHSLGKATFTSFFDALSTAALILDCWEL